MYINILIIALVVLSAVYMLLSVFEARRKHNEAEDNKLRAWARKARAEDIAKGYYREW